MDNKETNMRTFKFKDKAAFDGFRGYCWANEIIIKCQQLKATSELHLYMTSKGFGWFKGLGHAVDGTDQVINKTEIADYLEEVREETEDKMLTEHSEEVITKPMQLHQESTKALLTIAQELESPITVNTDGTLTAETIFDEEHEFESLDKLIDYANLYKQMKELLKGDKL